MATIQKAMPEFITRKDIAPRPWSVQEGAPVRGDAWTDMRAGQMRVPYGADDLSRIVRAHELMHAKVSPTTSESMVAVAKQENISLDLLISAEEFRVNMLIAERGFDTDHLADGSESKTGKIIGENGDWNGLVRFIPAVAGTKAGKDLLRGLKTSNPEFEVQAREVQKYMNKFFRNAKKRGVARIGSTTPIVIDETHVIPKGFIDFTVPIARFLQSLLIPEGADGVPDEFGEEAPVDVKKAVGGRGKFAPLILKDIPKPRHVDGRLGRRRMATNIGRNPRRINRMLVDPEKRIFDKRGKGKGGIVLIDQSGSMRLTEDDIWSIVESAPGCVIIGYSHRSGTNGQPNAWVIADRGKVADALPEGNGGNGVDGPAIRFAQSKRKHGEPFIWVCDGYVTAGDDDNYYPNLGVECAELVKRFGIHMVPNMDMAIKAIQRVATGRALPVKAIGQVYSEGDFPHSEDRESKSL